VSESPFLLKAFDRLDRHDEARLVEFVARDDLKVKGIDRTPSLPHRGGCLPYIGLVLAVAVGWLGTDWGLSGPVALGIALTLAILSLRTMIRTVRAVRRGKRLLAADEGWHALAWSKTEVCFRSLDRCLLAPFSAVQDVKVLGEDAGAFLRDTLWIHLDGKEKVLVEPRTEEGLFAGRQLTDWGDDLVMAWGEATGRKPKG
jgi:hypothetical protein